MKTVVGIAMVGVALAWFSPTATASETQSTALHAPGDKSVLVGCVGWQEEGARLVCADDWMKYKIIAKFAGDLAPSKATGPLVGGAVVWGPGCAEGVSRVVFKVVGVSQQVEGRSGYNC